MPALSLFPNLTIRKARFLLSNGLITAQDLCSYCYHIQQAGETIWNLNAFSQCQTLEELREQAEQADERRSRLRKNTDKSDQLISPLDGIPVSVKANLAVESFPLTAGSRILGAESTSATNNIGYDATVVQALKDSGAILMGITTMDEFGMGSLGSSHAGIGATRNPLPYLQYLRNNSNNATEEPGELAKIIQSTSDQIHEMHQLAKDAMASDERNGDRNHTDYSAGGSSCGGAASVAHGSSLISLGSDTGGSVRLPAAFTGLVGLKPTYGRLSRHGLVSYASSLDTVGILARTPHCAAVTMQELTRSTRRDGNDEVTAAIPQSSDAALLDSTQSQSQTEFSSSCRILARKDNHNNAATLAAAAETTIPNDFLSKYTIGIPEAFSVDECPDSVQAAWTEAAQMLESKGATIRVVPSTEISPTVLQSSLASYYVLVSAEASSNLARYDGFRYGVTPWSNGGGKETTTATTTVESLGQVLSEWTEKPGSPTLLEHQFATTRSWGFGPEVIRRILCGTAVLSSDRFHTYYEAAAKLRAVLTQQLHSCLQSQDGSSYDAILVPTSLSLPPRLDELSQMDPVDIYANDVMTVPASLAGLPALALPAGSVNDMMENKEQFRASVQLIGARMSEGKLLDIASVLERSS